MADKEPKEILEIFFPFKGFSEKMAYKDQPPLTSPLMANLRIKDAEKNRGRGGQRGGMKKVFNTQAGDNRPILNMVLITNTFIPPEE